MNPRKFKVLIIGPTPYPYTGMSVITEMLLDSFLQNKFKVIHLDTSDRRAISNMGKFDLTNIILALKHFFIFLYLCITKKPNVVYLPIAQNFLGFLRDTLFLIPCRIFNIKTVVHLNGAYFRQFYENSNILMKGVIIFSLRKVSTAIVLGECLRYIFKGLILEEKIVVVPNGVTDYFDGHLRKISRDGVFKILFLSNLLRTKGLFEVLKIIPFVASFHKNVKFIFAGEWGGEGEDKEAREFVERNNIEDYVEFVGIVKGEMKRRLLAEANLFVLPTFYPFEGQPFTILEAMSAALPVVSTDRGAIAETIIDGENGFLVEIKNSEQLTNRLKELIFHPDLRERMGRKNREIYFKKYTKDILVDNLYNILTKICEETVTVKEKILFIVPLPPPYAGPEVHSRILLDSLLKDKFNLIHLCSNLHKQNQDKGRIELTSSILFSTLVFRILWTFFYKKPKIVYTLLCQNFTGFVRDSIIVMICKVFHKKVILHFHGSNFENFYNNQSRFLRAYIGFILHRVDFIILQANRLKKFFSRFVPEFNLKVIYNPVTVERFFYKQQFNKKPDTEVRVFYMSYLSVAKGFLVLVDAIKEVLKEKQNIRFFIAGGIINKERNIFYSQNGKRIIFKDINKAIEDIKNDTVINSHTVFLNELTSIDKKRNVFFQSDIFVLPSYSEGCPMVILEAMAAGLPVIVTPVGALTEIIKEGENGFFIKIDDHIDLKEKILLLANNPILCKEMGRNNKLLVESRFTTKKIIPQFSDFFQEVIKYSL